MSAGAVQAFPSFGALLPDRIVWTIAQLDEHWAKAQSRRAVAMRAELHLDLADDVLRALAARRSPRPVSTAGCAECGCDCDSGPACSCTCCCNYLPA